MSNIVGLYYLIKCLQNRLSNDQLAPHAILQYLLLHSHIEPPTDYVALIPVPQWIESNPSYPGGCCKRQLWSFGSHKLHDYSIMVGMSHHDCQDGFTSTAALIRLCHEWVIAIGAEIGRIITILTTFLGLCQ
ncbi:hypothetical protein FPOAC1_002129 [Fusarium poae]|uniref:hypothetical protein n=1 Tax=Fusarium poae TaxID=36050 RepID=UPI001CE86E05|nr:hypothetical protein FPOAC1_002129 [Fusarium poae]KAG8676132.1 hypothetical protein FPOAC1_002129 [Fusarium poae]